MDDLGMHSDLQRELAWDVYLADFPQDRGVPAARTAFMYGWSQAMAFCWAADNNAR